MKLDIDRVSKKAVRFLIALQKPYEIRVSSGGTGVHIRKDCRQGCSQMNKCYSCWVYTQFDDQKRLRLNSIEINNNLCNNVLWDCKRGRLAQDWVWIATEQDADKYLRKFTGFY